MHTTPRRRHMVSNGIPVEKRTPSKHARGPCSAYVLATYGPDHAYSESHSAVECDIILEDGQRTILTHVPVCIAGSSSPEICAPWRPNPVHRNLDTGAPLQFPTAVPPGVTGAMQYGPGLALVSDLSALDSDRVMVNFYQGRADSPVITQGVVHPRASGGIMGGDLVVPWISDAVEHPMSPAGNVLYARRGGTAVILDEGGNLALDSTHAPMGPDGGVPVPPQPMGGAVTLNLAPTATITLRWNNNPTALKISHDGTNIKIDIGSEGAAQPVILGTAFQVLYDAHIHTVAGPETGPPAVLMSATPGVLSTKVKLDG